MPSKKADQSQGFFGQADELEQRGNGQVLDRSTGLGAVAQGFTREAFLAMQSDRDLAPSLAEEDEEEGYIPLGKPGKAYLTIHPDPSYELTYAFTTDFRKSKAKDDPYLVMRDMWAKFPPALLRMKRLLLCQSLQDEVPKPFLWLADRYEASESPSEFHKSVARVVARGRQGWGQALWDSTRSLYTWRRWSEGRMGVPPVPFWPERDFFEIVQETFEGRVIANVDHELIQANALRAD